MLLRIYSGGLILICQGAICSLMMGMLRQAIMASSNVRQPAALLRLRMAAIEKTTAANARAAASFLSVGALSQASHQCCRPVISRDSLYQNSLAGRSLLACDVAIAAKAESKLAAANNLPFSKVRAISLIFRRRDIDTLGQDSLVRRSAVSVWRFADVL